ADAVERQVRAFAPTPGAFFEFEQERYKVLAAEVTEKSGGRPGNVLDDRLTIACGRGAIRPIRIQRAGKPAMDAADLLRGKPIPAGTYLK
ncbi:MAG: methionyl-tRNA formyltransferase, partial [Novosphingobium sp.]|nr:methionyl-tRNA formyltransferase [Novosphingobium sp.]